MKIFKLTVLTIVFVSSVVYGGIVTGNITLKGKATGSTLIFGTLMDRNTDFVSIETLPGETGEAVVYKLAKAIVYSDAILEISEWSNTDKEKKLAEMADGDILRLAEFPPGTYFLAGDEKGFGIPQPPLFLSCTYDKTKDEIVLNWENPINSYDYIFFNHRRISGTSTSLRISRQQTIVDINDLDIRVFGVRNNLPSNITAIHIESKGAIQSELFGVPFTDGIAPNWKAWGTGENVEKDAFRQGGKYTNMKMYNPVLSLSTKPFYQIIRGSKNGDVHGIYRKFLGLTPGHTYRIISSLTTLDMNDTTGNNWSVSLCAAYNQTKDKDLTSQQMAGLSAIPNDEKGARVKEIASFGKGRKNTQGKFSVLCSDPASYITLPQDVNTITVWVRFDCNDPNGKIGFSGVRLEDITGNEKIKTLEQIQQEESVQEMKLLNREKAFKLKLGKKPVEPNE